MEWPIAEIVKMQIQDLGYIMVVFAKKNVPGPR